MIRLFIFVFCLSVLFSYCGNKKPHDDETSIVNPISNDSPGFKELQGTWVQHDKHGFALIEFKDSSLGLYYRFIDRKTGLDTIINDRFWYYKSKAKMGYWDSTSIYISTQKFRFDYKIKGDTLIEFDKMGEQGKFIKVYADEEKLFN